MSFKIYNNNSVNYYKSKLDINKYLAIRVGDYKYTSCNSDVNNWLICDGRSLLISSYQSLYNVIGTSFGSTGAGYFSLPDYRGRVPGAIGSGTGLTTRNLGSSVGAETHTLDTSQIPGHTHTGTTDSSGSHTHTITDPGHSHNYVNNVNNQGTDNAFATETAADDQDLSQTTGSSVTGITVDSSGAHTHTFTTQSTGGGLAHNNMQPTLFGMNVLILSKINDYNSLPHLDFQIIIEY